MRIYGNSTLSHAANLVSLLVGEAVPAVEELVTSESIFWDIPSLTADQVVRHNEQCQSVQASQLVPCVQTYGRQPDTVNFRILTKLDRCHRFRRPEFLSYKLPPGSNPQTFGLIEMRLLSYFMFGLDLLGLSCPPRRCVFWRLHVFLLTVFSRQDYHGPLQHGLGRHFRVTQLQQSCPLEGVLEYCVTQRRWRGQDSTAHIKGQGALEQLIISLAHDDCVFIFGLKRLTPISSRGATTLLSRGLC